MEILVLFLIVLVTSHKVFCSSESSSYLDQARALKPPDAKLRENGEFEGESWWNENAAIIVRFQQISCYLSLKQWKNLLLFLLDWWILYDNSTNIKHRQRHGENTVRFDSTKRSMRRNTFRRNFEMQSRILKRQDRRNSCMGYSKKSFPVCTPQNHYFEHHCWKILWRS